MIQFEYNGEKYPWQWTMRALIHISDRSGVTDAGEVGALIDSALMADGTDISRLRWIEHIACGGFYAADPVKFEKLGPGGVDAILSDDAAFPTMVAEIMRKSQDFIDKQANEQKKKPSRSLLARLLGS